MGPVRGLENLLHRHKPGRFDSRLIPGALRAVPAIFRAPARLDREQGTELHFAIVPALHADRSRARQEVKKRRLINGPKESELHTCGGVFPT